MKIALLNLPVDTNYGGMLQRYALVRVLEDMGHEVIHLNLRHQMGTGTAKQKILRCARRLYLRLRGKYNGPIRVEHLQRKMYDDSCRVTDKFYNRYIRHTKYITSKTQLADCCRDVDALVIGSDQVWRKEYDGPYGIGTYFGDFLPRSSSVRKIVYGASFGISEDALSPGDKEYLGPLYANFSAVSVREESGLELLNDYGWSSPRAEQVLDPTLLLSSADYSELIDAAGTDIPEGNMLCYILNGTEQTERVISELAGSRGLKPFSLSIDGKISVEQWLRSFRDADFVVTDSYHGLVFSIIMHKPVYLFANQSRGNTRFDSILNLCGARLDGDHYEGRPGIVDYPEIRDRSIAFLKRSI